MPTSFTGDDMLRVVLPIAIASSAVIAGLTACGERPSGDPRVEISVAVQ